MSLNNKINKLLKCLFLSIACISSGTIMANQQPSHQLSKGVIIDKNGENIYVIHPDKGIDSVSLKTGLINWHSDHAALPIYANNGKLVAQVENGTQSELSLASLNTVNGEPLHSKQFSLPKNISAPIADKVERIFNINVDFENNPNGEIYWEYNYKKAQGMVSENPPQPINFYGKINSDNTLSLPSMKMQLISAPSKKIKKAIAGNFLNKIQMDSNSRQFQSIDGEHILVSKLKKDPTKWNKYLWEIYDKSGNLVGSTSHETSYTSFYVSNKTLVLVSQPNARIINNVWIKTPLTLQAVSLDSGQAIWKKEVKDLKFNGPYPH